MISRLVKFAIEIAAQKGSGQDRAAVYQRDGELVVVLADGAGGTARGAETADLIVAAATTMSDPVALLQELDTCVAGQSTAVVMRIGADIVGSSVGDSGAWLIGEEIFDLTEHQQRKPLLGSGCAPIAFRTPFAGTLLVASDGLLRYAKRADIARLARAFDARGLIDLVRLPSGGLQDDVSVVLVRP